MDMYRTLARSRFTFSHQRDRSGELIGTKRIFEATGVGGTCLLTDHKKDLAAYFALDTELVTYASLEECLEKARWLYEHPAECLRIGQATQARVLREHTYAQRASQLEGILQEFVRH